MRTPLIVDGRNLLDPESRARRRLRLRGDRPRVARRSGASPRPRHPSPSSAPSWKPSSSPAGRPSGSARRRQGGRSRSFHVAGRPLAAYQVARARRGGRRARDRQLRGGAGGALRGRARPDSARRSSPVGEPEPLGRGGGLRLAAAGARGSGDVLRAERRRAPRRRLRRAARAPPRVGRRRDDRRRAAPRRRSASSSWATATSSPASGGAASCPHWVSCGVYVLGRGGARATPRARRPRADDVPRARREGPPAAFRHEGLWLTVNTPKDLRRAEEHRGVGRLDSDRPPGVGPPRCAASRRTSSTSTASPWTSSASRSRGATRSSSPRPTSYCGKILFIRAGEQLSLQFHQAKDETIYVHSGRIELEIGEPGKPVDTEVVAPGRAFRLEPGTVHRCARWRTRSLLEVSTPELDDVVRLEDRYGRAGDCQRASARLTRAHGDHGAPPSTSRISRSPRRASTRIEWADRQMPVLAAIRERFEKRAPARRLPDLRLPPRDDRDGEPRAHAQGGRRRPRPLRLEPALDAGRRRRGARRRVRRAGLRDPRRGRRHLLLAHHGRGRPPARR